MDVADAARFAFIVLTPVVVAAGALVSLFAVGALFWGLEHPDELRGQIQAAFRQPLAQPKAPGKDHYYRTYWAR
jgi:hypothetical protein